MPNQINSKNTSKINDAGDMHDMATMAESDVEWMSTAITQVRKEIKRIHALVNNGEIISQYHFSELITHLDMYEYLADDRRHHHAKEAKAYEVEWETNKKAVSL